MHIDLTIFGAVEALELGGKILRRGIEVVGRACIVREIVADRLLGDFLLEEICFVEEQDD